MLTQMPHPTCICTYREARLFVCTGTPVQPHDCAGLDGLPIRFRWAKIPPLTFEHIGLGGVFDSPATFRKCFGIHQPDENMDEYAQEEALFDDVHHPTRFTASMHMFSQSAHTSSSPIS